MREGRPEAQPGLDLAKQDGGGRAARGNRVFQVDFGALLVTRPAACHVTLYPGCTSLISGLPSAEGCTNVQNRTRDCLFLGNCREMGNFPGR